MSKEKKIEKIHKSKQSLLTFADNSMWKNIFLGILASLLIVLIGLFSYFYFQNQKASVEKSFLTNNTYKINNDKFYYGPNDLMENLESYNDIRKNLIETENNLLDLNLQTMTLTFFKNGKRVAKKRIAGKGRPGGWWETPPGIYRITGKRKQVKVAASSDENPVFMPYAMRFSGMFFVHAIPEFKDGSQLPGLYTEGCVRLDRDVAQSIYEIAPKGTTVLIYDEKKDDFKYNKTDISSTVFMAADLLNNETLFARNADSIVKLGDITKFLLFLAVTDWVELPFDKVVKTLDYQSEKSWIKIGHNYKMIDLSFPLLARNSNQVASEVSKRFKYVEPVLTMSKKAEAVGMKDTEILNSIGDRFENTASITDIEILMKYIYKSRDFILYSSRGKVKDLKYGNPLFKTPEKSKFKNIDGYVGGMTSNSFGEGIEYGFGVFKIKINNEIRPIGIVIYDSKDIEKDAKNILKKIKAFYSN